MVISAHETLLVQGSWHLWFTINGSGLKVHDYDARGKVAIDVRCKREDVR
jgi:hypothetical protein